MNLDESCHHMCVELGYMCDIHGVLSCDTRCPISSSQSTVEMLKNDIDVSRRVHVTI